MEKSEEIKNKVIYKKWWFWLIVIILLIGMVGANADNTNSLSNTTNSITLDKSTLKNTTSATSKNDTIKNTLPKTGLDEKENIPTETTKSISLTSIPTYKNKPYVEINNNTPFFSESDLTTSSYEKYSNLDSSGRCGVAMACIGKDIMPTEERGEIGSVKPSGWHTVKYNGIDGNYLYNRCHLIGYQLSGENANERNLITGTRYMNIEGMLPFENKVADYVKSTGNHVLYRVTPMYAGNNLLASGVLIEAQSVEDNKIQFNVYCYNVQPGIEINYINGESSGPEFTGATNTTQTNIKTENKENILNNTNKTDTSTSSNKKENQTNTSSNSSSTENNETTYILNTNTKKFHYASCHSAKTIKESNKDTFEGNRLNVINMGYSPCKKCNP